ncbi:hypothetical protein PO124_25385 [Bacillus licheniformis]|nr:hypothetical protein [Bacillus licheniformis]
MEDYLDALSIVESADGTRGVVKVLSQINDRNQAVP